MRWRREEAKTSERCATDCSAQSVGAARRRGDETSKKKESMRWVQWYKKKKGRIS